jgi:hypothetical protein
MTEPIKRGDMATIIEGALGKQSPNVGKVVIVGMFRGEHSKHGRIWRVHGENLVTELGVRTGEFDCAQAWLRKIEPPRPSMPHASDEWALTNQILRGDV